VKGRRWDETFGGSDNEAAVACATGMKPWHFELRASLDARRKLHVSLSQRMAAATPDRRVRAVTGAQHAASTSSCMQLAARRRRASPATDKLTFVASARAIARPTARFAASAPSCLLDS
jgi:hypothetical protein